MPSLHDNLSLPVRLFQVQISFSVRRIYLGIKLEVIQSVQFRYEPNEQIRQLLKDYLDMVNSCIRAAVEARVTSLGRIHHLTYAKLKKRYDYNTQFLVTAYRTALSIVRSWRKHKHKGIPVAKRPIIRLSKLVTKLNPDGTLRVSVRPKEFATLKLVVGDYQRRFLESRARTGEILLNDECVIIPFKREISPAEPRGLLALDLNETNVTGVDTSGGSLRVDLSEIRRIRETYAGKGSASKRNCRGSRNRSNGLWRSTAGGRSAGWTTYSINRVRK